MNQPTITDSPIGNHPEQTSEQASDELVVYIGERQLTLHPEFSTIILCEKGGRVCVEKIEDEHIFKALYELLQAVNEDDGEAMLEAMGMVRSVEVEG